MLKSYFKGLFSFDESRICMASHVLPVHPRKFAIYKKIKNSTWEEQKYAKALFTKREGKRQSVLTDQQPQGLRCFAPFGSETSFKGNFL